MKSKVEITKHLDHNLQEVETLKKVFDNRDDNETESWDKKPVPQKISGPNSTNNQNTAEHRASTILEIDPNI